MKSEIFVVAAIIYNPQQQILIAKRPDHKHLGGLWEFPGGKIETDETPLQALQRELKEEINIDIITATPFMKLSNDYQEKLIHLDVWKVTAFNGIAHGNEGQPILWIDLANIEHYEFPPANKEVIAKLLKIK